MTLPDLDTLERLPEPFEIMELGDGGRREITPERFELGKAMIHPRDGRPEKVIPVLRLHVPPEDKPTLPGYWDVTSKHLIAGLLGYLEAKPQRRRRFSIRKVGSGPQARFTLDAVPIG